MISREEFKKASPSQLLEEYSLVASNLLFWLEAALTVLNWEDRKQDWEEFGMYGARCADCGKWMTVVRPGKYQCDYCGWKELVSIASEWMGREEKKEAGKDSTMSVEDLIYSLIPNNPEILELDSTVGLHKIPGFSLSGTVTMSELYRSLGNAIDRYRKENR